MRYGLSFKLASTCEDSFIWYQNFEDNISIVIGGQSFNLVYQEICLQLYLKMKTRGSNGLSIEIKHKFVISPMIKRDGHK
jgi:hypothetical protein